MSSAANNVTIKNFVLDGWFIGVQIQGPNAIVSNNILEAGVIVSTGQNVTISGNQVANISSYYNPTTDYVGIRVSGNGAIITNNKITRLYLGQNSIKRLVGLYIQNGRNYVVRNNIVDNLLGSNGYSSTSAGPVFGILVENVTLLSINSNNVSRIYGNNVTWYPTSNVNTLGGAAVGVSVSSSAHVEISSNLVSGNNEKAGF